MSAEPYSSAPVVGLVWISTRGLVAGLFAATFVVSSIRARELVPVLRGRGRVGRELDQRRCRTGGAIGVSDAGFGRGVTRISGVVPAHLGEAIRATGIPWAPERVVGAWAVLLVGAVVIGVRLGGVPTAAIGAVGISIGGIVLIRMNRHRRRDLADRALPAFLESTARSLRSGASLSQSVIGAGRSIATTPLGDDVAALTWAIERGSPLVTTFDQWAVRADSEPKRRTARALSLVAETGGAPGPLVDAVAQTLRERDQIEREARALATQARASAVVIAIAPLAFTVMATTVDPGIASFLFRSLPGLGCLVVGLVAEGVGAWWMSHLVGTRR